MSILAKVFLLLLSAVVAPTPDQTESASLFDGKSLDGWVGAKDAYKVEDGLLVHRLGARGNLFSAKEYGDFVLHFEFQLTPGANNGLAIRAPLKDDSAYAGIELQILDNTAEKYQKLQPYQYHGSAYGIAAAKRGALKPVGEWNVQEVRCQGRQITVILNGKKILDIDLDKEAPAGKTVDGKKHPGLSREKGHIGFLGHGDQVHFRNIRIRELQPNSQPPKLEHPTFEE